MKKYLVIGGAALLGAACLIAYAGNRHRHPETLATESEPTKRPGLIAREWGTFTAVVGSDGREVPWWTPSLEGLAALPEFVKRPSVFSLSKRGLPGFAHLVRMETPVIYFYAEQPIDLSISVDATHVGVTEVFPSTNPPQSLNRVDWSVEIRPPGDPVGRTMPAVGSRGAHYAQARAVPDACWVVRRGKDTAPEVEKFVFYRGAGDAAMPKRIHGVADDSVQILRGPAAQFLIEIDGRGIHWTRINWLDAAETGSDSFPFPSVASKAEREEAGLATALTDELARSGLTQPEARAMVETWRGAWLGEPGLRLLEILPRDWVDKTLPLSISPAPEKLERVFVARWELLTPEIERKVIDILELTGGPERKIDSLRQLSLHRFGGAVLDRAAQIRDADFRAKSAALMWSLNPLASSATVSAP